MKKFKLFILTLIVLLMTSGVYAADLNTKTSDNSNLLKVGDEFNVTFEENSASTGYQWCFRASTDGVLLVKNEYFPPKTWFGISGKRVFTFKTTKSGQQSVMFELLRPWDTANPIDTKTFTVNCL